MVVEDEVVRKRFDNVSKSRTFGNILDLNTLRSKSVLDIGCSFGEFLVHFGRGSVGITIDPPEAEYGVARGLDIRVGNAEEDELPVSVGEKFDVVFANNILEHLYSPHAFLVKIKKFLKEDGFIVIGVPCVPKIVSLWKFRKFRGSLANSHINFFTRMTLEKTVEKAGWRIITTRSFHTKNSTLDYVLNLISPHFYVVAKVNKAFEYGAKRQRELAGYEEYKISR